MSKSEQREARRQQRMKAYFEAEINLGGDFYNLMSATVQGQTYWSLHAERAWKVFQLGVKFADGDTFND